MKIKPFAVALILAGTLAVGGQTKVSAYQDTDIYFTDPSATETVIRPNLLLVLDTSGSMNQRVSGTNQSRIDVMKDAIKGILDDLDNVNVGLMRFSSNPGAGVTYPIRDLDAVVADTGKIQTVMQDAQDDATQDGAGNVSVTGTALRFNSSNPHNGVRFQDVYVPQGAIITSAKIVFLAAESDSDALSLLVSADNVDNAQTYEAVSDNLTGASRPQTSSVTWNADPWTAGSYFETPDVSAVVQQVVNRSGWCRGNAMAFRFTHASGAGERVAHAYDAYHVSISWPIPAAAALVVTYDPATVPTSSSCNQVVARVRRDTDDAEERNNNGNMTLTGSLQLIRSGQQNQTVGIRFQGVKVPQGAAITSARLEFQVNSTNSSATSLTITGENVDDAATFSGINRNITDRLTTGASVAWSGVPDLAVGQKLVSPDISPVVQEIVNRAGWAESKAMAFVITGSGTKNVESYDTSPAAAPLLRITYASNVAQPKRVRDVLKELIAGMRAEGFTPIVDSLYEAALYYRGDAVDYGRQRGPGTTESPPAIGAEARWARVSHPGSYTGGTVKRFSGCTDDDLDAASCVFELVSGSPIYISPITASCQPNHVVLLTDGEATVNNSQSKVLAMTGESSCSDSGNDACGVTLTGFLRSSTQRITTHTIGYQIANTFLQNLANSGGGSYRRADSASELTQAFKGILNEVLKSPTSYVSPSLSVNAFNRLFNRDEVYFSLFSPQLKTAWPGNLKKYVLCNDNSANASCQFGEVMDSTEPTPLSAIGVDAKIKTTAKSFWSVLIDGPTVTLGAAGSKVPAYTARRAYTYTGLEDKPASAVDLTVSAHRVETANTAITAAMLNAADDTERTRIINWMRGQDTEDEDSDGETAENRWAFADALHSRPLTVTYGGNASDPIIKILVGTNDGGLRMINTNTGEEEWIVYLPEFLGRQKTLMDNFNDLHTYGVDGSPSVLTIDHDNDGVIDPTAVLADKVYAYIGMRRGGRDIYAFDITPEAVLTSATSATGVKPRFLWRIKGGAGNFTALGETWSQPLVATIRVKCQASDNCDDGSGDTTTLRSKRKTVLIFGGGYDNHQDSSLPNGVDTMGNAIYIVDPLTGARIWWAGGPGSGADLELANMKYSIPSDTALFDTNRDGAIDRIFVGDSRGQLWRIDLGSQIDESGTGHGSTSGYVFADVGCSGGVRSDDCAATRDQDRRRFFYRPDIAQVRDANYSSTPDYDLIAIGTGDREDPLDKKTTGVEPVNNRIYALRDVNVKTGAPATLPAPLTDADLFDATDNVLQDPGSASASTALADIKSKKGWFIDLKEPTVPNWVGEKVLARPVIFDGALLYTTYLPTRNAGTEASCPVAREGAGRTYALNYLTGAAVYDFNDDATLGTSDRFATAGGGIPSEWIVVIREGGVTTLVGTSGGAAMLDIGLELPRYTTYWYEE